MLHQPALARPADPRRADPCPAGVMQAMRSTVSRWMRGGERRASPTPARRDVIASRGVAATAWMSPPPERPLPRDLNLPLSAFDPGALRHLDAPSAPAAAFDPIMLERTLHRLRTLTAQR